METTSVKFFCQDVICRYWPWLQRLVTANKVDASLIEAKPFLSVMHGKAHDWKCQVME